MVDLPESAIWEAGVFQLETDTPVLGGVDGPSNTPLRLLTNRTAYLKNHVDALELALPLKAPLNSPALTGTPISPTPPDGDNSNKIVTTAWVQALVRGLLSKSISGGTISLTATEAGKQIIVFTGTLAAAQVVIFPDTVGRWIIANRTTGPYSLTVRNLTGTGVSIGQGQVQEVWCDGTDMFAAVTEGENFALTGTPTAPTATPTTATNQVASTGFARQFSRGATTLNLASGGSFTLTDTQAARPVVILSGTPFTAATVVFPAEAARWLVKNTTPQTVTLKTSAQATGLAIQAGQSREIYSDGSNLVSSPSEVDAFNLRGAGSAVTPSLAAAGQEIITAEWVRSLFSGQLFHSTADMKLTLKSTPDAGWVMLNGQTLGNAASSATGRANADTADLFAFFWNTFSDALCPVSGGRGASAAADFAAAKSIKMLEPNAKAIFAAGAAAGLTTRALGSTFGAEGHVLTLDQIPSHNHGGATNPAGAHSTTVTITPDGTHAHGGAIAPGGEHGHPAASGVAGGHVHQDGHESFYHNFGGGTLVGLRQYGTANSMIEAWQNANTSLDGDHQHEVIIGAAGTHGHGLAIYPDGLHGHGATASNAPDHQHGIPVAGGGLSHPNIPPGIAFNVMIKL